MTVQTAVSGTEGAVVSEEAQRLSGERAEVGGRVFGTASSINELLLGRLVRNAHIAVIASSTDGSETNPATLLTLPKL